MCNKTAKEHQNLRSVLEKGVKWAREQRPHLSLAGRARCPFSTTDCHFAVPTLTVSSGRRRARALGATGLSITFTTRPVKTTTSTKQTARVVLASYFPAERGQCAPSMLTSISSIRTSQAISAQRRISRRSNDLDSQRRYLRRICNGVQQVQMNNYIVTCSKSRRLPELCRVTSFANTDLRT